MKRTFDDGANNPRNREVNSKWELVLHKRHPVRVQQRRDEAEERQAGRDKRSAKQQIALLDKRLGKNKGAKKERARLNSK